MAEKMKRHIKDPGSAITHFIGMLMAIFAAVPLIIKAAKETGAIVTAEEHNIIGGLGSAVAEVLCENYPVPMQRVGTQDVYGKSGKPAALLEMYGLDAKTIAEKAKAAIAKKNA